MRRFDQELSELHHQLIEMGTLAESMVTTAVKALEDLTQDVEEALQTSEDMLDEMQNVIDKEVVRILTVYSPVATDLRTQHSGYAKPRDAAEQGRRRA